VNAPTHSRPPRAARDALTAALECVPHDAWVAVQFGPELTVGEVLASSESAADELTEIAVAEHALRVHRLPDVPVVRSRAALGRFVDGLTVVDKTGDELASLLVMLRNERRGRFTEAEIAALTPVAGALAALRQHSPEPPEALQEHVRARKITPLFVLDLDCEIEMAPLEDDDAHAGIETIEGRRLTPRFEAAVRRLTALWDPADETTLTQGVAAVGPTFILRTVPMRGRHGLRIGVYFERARKRSAIRDAALKYGFSPRELDVLALVLDGCETREIAEILRIAPSTSADHVKRLLAKTHSRNRAELVARTLGWKSEAHK
jgi:DNA-binding CsgD family transcriptional regulator